MIRYFYWKSTT